MWVREVLFDRPLKVSGALLKMPLEGAALPRAAQKASFRSRQNTPTVLSLRIINAPQATRASRVSNHRQPVTINIKTWIIAWERRDARRRP